MQWTWRTMDYIRKLVNGVHNHPSQLDMGKHSWPVQSIQLVTNSPKETISISWGITTYFPPSWVNVFLVRPHHIINSYVTISTCNSTMKQCIVHLISSSYSTSSVRTRNCYDYIKVIIHKVPDMHAELIQEDTITSANLVLQTCMWLTLFISKCKPVGL